jgi:hypothetical protein
MRHKDPFGKPSCEQEIDKLGNKKYIDLFFEEAPFNDVAVDEDTYLIIGRRGSGKTSLARYFSFQKRIPNPICIEVLQAHVYQQVLSEISRRTSEARAIAVAHLQRVWEFVIWSLILNSLKVEGGKIITTPKPNHSSSHKVADLIEFLMRLFSEEDETTIGLSIERIVDNAELEKTKEAALQLSKKRPIIIAIDTLEQYNIEDDALMNALAALIEYAARFNSEFASRNIHLKVFVSGEVFPYIKEAVLLNPLKTIQHPVYLSWRPRDLLRLIGWRFYCHLENSGMWQSSKEINWEKDSEVLEKVWNPYFGSTIKNACDLTESTWTYVLRHTQMRPRQLIYICNSIANRSIEDGSFPNFRPRQIVSGVYDAELQLASEILNSFSEIYDNADKIVTSALTTMPKVFKGNELDKRARQSASEWTKGDYSPSHFRQLVTELGIVGRAARGTEDAEYIDADFEYSSTERLVLTHHDTCVVHPMFYRKLNVELNTKSRVMPFTSTR